jgi:hypothetical protein
MKKCGRVLAAEKSRDPDLAAGRCEEIDTADDVVDALPPIIDRDGELVGPVATPIAEEHVTALLLGILPLRPELVVVELLDARIHPQTPAVAIDQREALVSAQSRVSQLGDFAD